MLKTTTLEMGGISRKDFEKYFLKIGGETDDRETFKGEYWEALVGPETRKSGDIFRLPRVSITLKVTEDRFDEFLAAFRISFLRGGG